MMRYIIQVKISHAWIDWTFFDSYTAAIESYEYLKQEHDTVRLIERKDTILEYNKTDEMKVG